MSRPQPWIRRVVPLRLREIMYWRLYWPRHQHDPAGPVLATGLTFAPSVRMELARNNSMHTMIAAAGFYELRISELMQGLARRGGLLLDAGAEYGYYSLLWAAARSENRVLAFEPAPPNAAALARNVLLNGMADRVTIKHEALAAEAGTAEFTLGEQTGWGRIRADGMVTDPARRIEVSVTSLDRAWAELVGDRPEPRIDVLKIDCEGYDALVLEGAAGLLREHKIGHVFAEINTPLMGELGIESDRPERLLGEAGYEVDRFSDGRIHAWLKR